MNRDEMARTLEVQCGVMSRRQVLELGDDDNDIERLLRRREWARAFDGVYVDHTGPLTTQQLHWSAVLLHWPAALTGRSALEAHGVTLAGPRGRIEVAVAAERHPLSPPAIRTRRTERFADVALMNLSPPRVRVEHAVLTVAAESRRDDAAVAQLADVCQRRKTTPARLLTALDDRPRLRRRRLLAEILDDVASGAYSAMERRYLREVERRHGLPTARRQRRVRSGRTPAYRDVEYVGLATVVELDGRLGHERAMDRWADLDRDIDSATVGDLTVRVGWGQVLEPCRLAWALARLLAAKGWRGDPSRCSEVCVVPIAGDLPAPGAGKPPETAA